MGKKSKAEKNPAKGKPAVTFDDVAASFTRTTHAILLGLKSRTGGAQDYGADGLFVCAVEALHTARATKTLEDYLKSAAYSLAAALKASGTWDYPVAAPAEVKKAKKGMEKSDDKK